MHLKRRKKIKGRIINKRLKERRLEIDYTQKEVAELSGITKNLYQTIEMGRKDVSYDIITKIAEVLNLDLKEIYITDFRETKVIAVANNKGGCGKTSVVSSLSHSIKNLDKEYKILIIDSDMQMNLTRTFNFERNLDKNLNKALVEEESLLDYIIPTEYENMDIILSDLYLSTIEMTLFTKKLRETIFKRLLKPIIDKGIYDFIIIDTNPTLGLLNFNVLSACDYVLVPVELSAFGVQGLEIVINFINDVKIVNPKLKLLGILRTKVDRREKITKETEDVLFEVFKDELFESYIPIDATVKKAQWAKIPLVLYDKKSRAAKQYHSLAKEVIRLAK